MTTLNEFSKQESISRSVNSLLSLQIARCVACLLVVLHHTIRLFTANAPPSWSRPIILDYPYIYERLAIGVDVFFIISGFIMTYVAAPYIAGRKPISDFLKKRIFRIYPAYLIITLSLLILLFLNYLLHGNVSYDLSFHRVIGSITLFPTFNKNGEVQPLLGVGWTLSFEIYFYLLFSITVALFRGNFLVPMVITIVSLISISRLLPTAFALSAFVDNTVTVEFIFGCMIGHLYLSRWGIPKPLISLPLLAISIVPLFVFDASSANRFLLWGIPSAFFVIVILNYQFDKNSTIVNALSFLGDASYSLYLVHIPILYILFAGVVERFQLFRIQPSNIFLLVILAFFCALISGALFYTYVEKPVNKRVRAIMRF